MNPTLTTCPHCGARLHRAFSNEALLERVREDLRRAGRGGLGWVGLARRIGTSDRTLKRLMAGSLTSQARIWLVLDRYYQAHGQPPVQLRVGLQPGQRPVLERLPWA